MRRSSPRCRRFASLVGRLVGWLCVRPSNTRSSHAPFVSRVLLGSRPSHHTAYPNYFFFQIIGPGGKIIRQIIDDFSLDSMDVEEDGRVMISSFNSTSAARREVTPRLCDCLRRIMDLPTFLSPCLNWPTCRRVASAVPLTHARRTVMIDQ